MFFSFLCYNKLIMEFDPSFLEPEHVSKHELLLDINETALQLISTLRIHRESDIERAILNFDVDQPGFALPGFIRRNMAEDSSVQDLVIDAEVNRLTNQAQIDIRVGISGAEDGFMNITTGGPGNQEPRSSLMIGDDEIPCLEPVSKTELNRFLASLFVKNKTGDYSAFDPMDLGNATTCQRLVDALHDVASETILDETYYLGDTIGLTTDSIRFTEYDGSLHSATVNIEHHAKASGIEISFTNERMPRELDEDIDDAEFLMQELEGARTYTQNVNGESTRTPSTNEFLIVVRDFLHTHRASVFTQPDVSPLSADIADPSLNINIEDDSRFTD